MNAEFTVRNAQYDDLEALLDLYRAVAAAGGGIARNIAEIDLTYIEQQHLNSKAAGLQLVVEEAEKHQVVAELHCYSLGPVSFRHVLSALTIVVHPDFQGRGIGKLIFSSLISHIVESRPDILRIELITKASNTAARKLYEKLGFKEEGVFANRILNPDGTLEADIPMAWFNPAFQYFAR